MDRHIACFDIPGLEIALTRLRDPSLHHRPLAVASSPSPRASLIDLSDEALGDGLRAGVSLEEARRRCPSLQVFVHSRRRVQEAHGLLQEAVAHYAPIWEPVRPGQFYLDLTGTTRLFGRAVDTAVRLEREVKERHGLRGVLGVATNKLVSRVAASVLTPAHVCDVRAGSESAFVSPVLLAAVTGLQGARGKAALRMLDDLNITTLGELAPIPISHLELAVGPLAEVLHAWAHGIDPSPVWPMTERPALEVSAKIDPSAIDDQMVWGHVAALMESLCRTLRVQQRVCRRLRLTLQHDDHQEISRHRAFPQGTYWEIDIEPVLRALLFASFQRRVRVKQVTLRAEGLGPPDVQTDLFAREAPEERTQVRRQRLTTAVDAIRDRFGDQAVWWGRSHPSHACS